NRKEEQVYEVNKSTSTGFVNVQNSFKAIERSRLQNAIIRAVLKKIKVVVGIQL
ncbi:4019_t:CDS:1, partial [Gigaspora rosea]